MDLVRTRSAARAAAAAAFGAPALVPMRACMCFQDKLPAGCCNVDQEEWGGCGGIVTAAVASDNSRSGKGADVVWIVVVPTVRGSKSDSADPSECEGGVIDGIHTPVQVTGVRAPPGYHVRQVAFYGSVPGVPTQNEARLALVLEPVGEKGQSSELHMLNLDYLSFSQIATLVSLDDESLSRRTASGSRDVVAEARAQGVETPLLSELSIRSRSLPEHVKGVTVALSGARGMACAVSTSKHIMVFDLEEDEEEEEE